MKLFIPNFPDSLNKALKVRAALDETSKAELIIRFLRAMLKKANQD